MTDQDWHLAYARCLGCLMVGKRLAERDEQGDPVMDDDLLILLNAHHDAVDFVLPAAPWEVLLDTAREDPAPPGKNYRLEARSLVLLATPMRTAPSRTDA